MSLCSYADNDGFCFPAAVTLAKRTHQSRATVHAALNDLEESGMIARTGKKGLVNVYQIMVIQPGQDVQILDTSCQDVQPLDRGSTTIVQVPVQEIDTNNTYSNENYINDTHSDKNKNTNTEEVKDPVNPVLDLKFFHRQFPSDFVGPKNAYANRTIRELVAAALVVYPLEEIERLLEAYEPRMTEQYCPSPGKTVYVFFVENKLSAIKRFVDQKKERTATEKWRKPYQDRPQTQADLDLKRLVITNRDRKHAGLPIFHSIEEMKKYESEK